MGRFKNRKKKRTLLKVTLSIVLFLAVGAGAYGLYLYSSVKDTASQMHEEYKTTKPKPKVKNGKDPISILLMGVDERAGDRGRSDSIIMMTLNPKTDSMEMVSIPRDTRTEIVGKGTQDKINHAYAFGGTEMAVKSVENFTNVPVDYFIKVNMEALSELVDSVGGITVNNKLDWYDDRYYKKGYHYKKGKIELDGPQTLGYVRMRYQDPRGDFGRSERQRQVIEAIIDKGANISSFTKVDNILNAIGSNVKTNMTFGEMKDVFSNYRSAKNNIEQYQVKGSGTKIDGIYYLQVSEDERSKVTALLKDSLTAKK
ncbi:LCP family protein [Pseudalkalibacillus caeni]|uniref:Transcriptional regulator LytR n=1 Tax=Exobacillus caeni TaxID=2574798 RepID=A0A5R9EWH9_9BACL|nr:LCP family protein [Pseudalkalibacillus caeni]TLS35181.1 transcriptional regulator LytR [Pseudalkalibacillus caeni]